MVHIVILLRSSYVTLDWRFSYVPLGQQITRRQMKKYPQHHRRVEAAITMFGIVTLTLVLNSR